MKLRINNNSIRLRLTQSEVEEIGKGIAVCQTLNLYANKELNFGYSLIPLSKSEVINAQYTSNKLVITVPKSLATTWAGTDQVTLRHVQDKDTKSEVLILIEKDFQCLHKRPDEDESNNFPNPKATENSDY
jgi:hypothetical protein